MARRPTAAAPVETASRASAPTAAAPVAEAPVAEAPTAVAPAPRLPTARASKVVEGVDGALVMTHLRERGRTAVLRTCGDAVIVQRVIWLSHFVVSGPRAAVSGTPL